MLRRELRFLGAIWKTNLLAVLEYRGPFIAQVLGMILNNAIYFLFWVLFFDRFESVRGWALSDMFTLFGVAALSFGLGVFLFGNVLHLATIIANGRLDYYLALPRPVLLHALAGRSQVSGLGDVVYGLISFGLAGNWAPGAVARFALAVVLAVIVFVAYMVIVNSLAFWLGDSSALSQQATNALITFALYPGTLFGGATRIVLLTLIPAAFIGAVPVEFIGSFSVGVLLRFVGAALLLLALAVAVFNRGLRRYESGSAIQIQA